MSSRFRRYAVALAVVAISGVASIASATFVECGTPSLSVPAYAKGDSNLVSWTLEGTGIEGGGFILQVGYSSATNFSGDFLDPARPPLELPPGTRSVELNGLEETEHFYRIKTKTDGASCTVSRWSQIQSTTQDATPPIVKITSHRSGDLIVSSGLTISGTLTDTPGRIAPTSSGPRTVTLILERKSPLPFGDDSLLFQQRYQRIVPADGGSWDDSIELPPGTYEMTAIGQDGVGNQSAAEGPVHITVVSGGSWD